MNKKNSGPSNVRSNDLLYNLVLKREKRLRQALEWALGVRGDFKIRREGDGPFWWRNELQKRAGLKWNGKKFFSV